MRPGQPVNGADDDGVQHRALRSTFSARIHRASRRLQYITHMAVVDSFNTQRDTNAFIGGDIWKLPAGEWKFSAGFENRRESAAFTPDDYYTQDLGQTKTTGIEGSYVTNEAYFETLVADLLPSCKIFPGWIASRRTLKARRVDNSIAGNATTYTYALAWSPIEDVVFRANKTKSIRAPSITELFLPTAQSFLVCQRSLRQELRGPRTGADNTRRQLRGSNRRL